tara:strand:- start:11349 stop:11528 length:180 start_codon:yes stop_codon:yes gene_type:complete
MLQKVLLFASPFVSAATIATVITVKSLKKRKHPHITAKWDDDDDYTGGPGEGPYWWYTK